jgi:uncharacterized protein YdeI (YjbR/CyaY-like superfamily)
MGSEHALDFPNGLEWRKWLGQNHATQKGVWLVHHKKASDKHSVSHSDAVDEALCFGWIDGQLKSIDEEKYALCTSSDPLRQVGGFGNEQLGIV